jgi:hypothetical protein
MPRISGRRTQLAPSEINHRDFSQAHRNLGIWQTPSGCQDEQFSSEILDKRANDLPNFLLLLDDKNVAPHQPGSLSIFGLSCCSTTMSYDQLNKIQKPMINEVLPKMGCAYAAAPRR